MLRSGPITRIDQPLPSERVPGGEVLQRSSQSGFGEFINGGLVGNRTPIIFAEYDGMGSAIVTPHVPITFRINFSGKIVAWTLMSEDTVGSVEIDVWRAPYSPTTSPTVADTITSGTPPALVAEKNKRFANPAWITGFSDGDVFSFYIVSASVIKWCILELETELG